MDRMRIDDESGDRKYFTIIPNFIINHSNSVDQALYMQMKRYAGENGVCFASEKLLQKKLKVGRVVLKRSIKYLLEHNWITHKGGQIVQTKGGDQMIKVYSVNDLWRLNNEFYEGVSKQSPPKKRGVQIEEKGCPNSSKGVSKQPTKKNHIIRTIEEEGISQKKAEEKLLEVRKSLKKRHII